MVGLVLDSRYSRRMRRCLVHPALYAAGWPALKISGGLGGDSLTGKELQQLHRHFGPIAANCRGGFCFAWRRA